MTTRDPIVEALALRAAALALLAGREPDARARDALLSAPERAWQLLLVAECCAAPLAAALRRQGWGACLGPGILAVLARAEAREVQRVLAARAQLRQLDETVASLGLAPVVLKGGAVVGERTVDLGDLDVAEDLEGCHAIAEALLQRGYRPDGASGDWHVASTAAGRRAFGEHLPPLLPASGLPVELHVRDGDAEGTGRRPRLLPGCRVLRREVGAGPLFDLVHHAVVHHPHRRGHLRDLVVIAEAIAHCTGDEIAAVRTRCAADRYAPELSASLEQALAVAAGQPVPESAETRAVIARKYALALGREAWLGRAIPRWRSRLAFVAVDRPAIRRHELRALVRDAGRSHPAYAMPWLARRAPRLAGAVASMAARGYRLAVAGVVLGAGVVVRRRVERLLAAV